MKLADEYYTYKTRELKINSPPISVLVETSTTNVYEEKISGVIG